MRRAELEQNNFNAVRGELAARIAGFCARFQRTGAGFGRGSVWENIPSGAKAHGDVAEFMYGLKPVPFNQSPYFSTKACTFRPKPVPFNLTHGLGFQAQTPAFPLAGRMESAAVCGKLTYFLFPIPWPAWPNPREGKLQL
jgi:hypothetical protein